ncbi:flippase-like domain-containing protein [Solirubrobacter sp. CPCC 204708]|uniref:Flippase-like domain-containing protein n=1 Tax=Solirubrobacter deserti TaxID=2282478 RepID=A0ABT4REQ4_9ACTN|nr:lysylphosphatidylglycerol synthase domain-containing protein [Solirubrobacter deserti]MBE2318520.1 flippase-like domain-containing protein [Solirubrobacter deserti]MDA0136978.1 flippase-like domain-containing protein [Solirubrobacter deserti]
MARAHEAGIDFRAVGKRALFFAVVAVLAIVALAELPGIDEVRTEFSQAEPGWIVAAAVFRIGSMLGFVRALWSAFDRVMPWRRALVLGLAEQGANVLLPAGGAGGPAYGAYVLTRLGVPADLAAQRHAALFLVTSAVSFAAIIVAGTLTAIGLLPGEVALIWTLGPAAAIGALFALVVLFGRSDPPQEPESGRVRHLVWRVWGFVRDGVRTSLQLVLHGDPLLIVGSITYFAFDVASLACMFHAFGGGAPDLGVFVLAYALGHAGALIPTPGGVGGTEGGLIGAFVAYGTALPLATAAVVGYRVFQLGLPALFGAAALVRVQHVLAHPPPREEVAARFEAHRWR